MMIQFFSPIIVGIVSGLLYGGSFLLQHLGMLSSSPVSNKIQQFGLLALRMLIVFIAGQYLLRSNLLPSILGSLAFFSIFWALILVARMRINERTGSHRN